ncbi:MAG: GNAT family N-acetyltransferase [Limosilactobacillus sp.]
MKTVVKTLDEMTAVEWCRLLEERVKVFVVEQDCPYQEVDSYDYQAHHLTLWDDDGKLVGYTRIYRRQDGKVTFGRVLVPMQYRKHHYGRYLVEQTIAAAHRIFNGEPIQIQAQAYLKKFYGSLGFQAISDVYLEDGIPHLDMVLPGED